MCSASAFFEPRRRPPDQNTVYCTDDLFTKGVFTCGFSSCAAIKKVTSGHRRPIRGDELVSCVLCAVTCAPVLRSTCQSSPGENLMSPPPDQSSNPHQAANLQVNSAMPGYPHMQQLVTKMPEYCQEEATLPGSRGEKRSTPRTQSNWLAASAANRRGSNAEDIQSHYDLSNEFFRLWLDENRGLQLRLLRT